MSKLIYIKLTKTGPNSGPFNIYDGSGGLIAENITMTQLVSGVSYTVGDDVTSITLSTSGTCYFEKTEEIIQGSLDAFLDIITDTITTGCIWRHLTNPVIYNRFYGKIEPYIIEYPFAYTYFDEILQNVKDYTRVYRYLPNYDGAPYGEDKIELDNEWFNKAILYNGQQCSGVLELVPKPLHNLKEYMSYPKYNANSKTITYTKSDGWYQYNTFWSIVKDKTKQLFTRTCDTMSIDKIINQSNMDYSTRSFKKEPLRAKYLKIRHILDNKSDIHLVSHYTFSPSQISYK